MARKFYCQKCHEWYGWATLRRAYADGGLEWAKAEHARLCLGELDRHPDLVELDRELGQFYGWPE